MVEGGLICFSVYFTSHGCFGVYGSLICGICGTRLHYGRAVRCFRQFSAGKPWVLVSIWMWSTTSFFGFDLPSKFPRFQSNHYLWDLLAIVRYMVSNSWRPHMQFTGTAANILVPDTTGHINGSSGVHATMGQGCFGSNKGYRQYIRKVVTMLCLIGIVDNDNHIFSS